MADACLSAQVERIARTVRAFLEPRWVEWHQREGDPAPRVVSQGTCGRSSLFLRDVLRAEGLMAEFVAGTPGQPGAADQGFRCGGEWCGHAWVECGDWIVDVTADQFGDDPVIVTFIGDRRYRHGVDGSEPQYLKRRARVARDLMGEWKAQMKEGVEHAT